MTDAVLNRLAQRLLKCPFDPELFDSAAELQSHLLECHGDQICEKRRVPKRVAQKDIERPTAIHICGLCFEFMVPNIEGRNALSEIPAHGKETHSNPNLPPSTPPIWRSDDAALIDKFMTDQGLEDVCPCRAEGCRRVFSDVEAAAVHWTKEHVEHAKAEDVRHALESDPERDQEWFGELLAAEMEAEQVRTRPPIQAPDDAYPIHHMPSVPRVRSKPGEFIVYVERELARMPEIELLELMEIEEFDSMDAELLGGEWVAAQETSVDLRFCNIVDGYIPLVKAVRGILPPLVDGQTIDVSWHADPDSWFPCKVSKSNRAIYNMDGRLKKMFGLHSGVRLYITRVGQRRYQLSALRKPHTVPKCKFFVSNGTGGWHVEFRDELVEWETGDDVFRHQITFEEMEALHAEARRTNLSVRDAVRKVMERDVGTQAWHVRQIYEAVFPTRTCSLAAVWAQFRPEHECYVRVGPGRYRFDPNGVFPEVRVLPPSRRNEQEVAEHERTGRAAASKLRILVHWSEILKMPCPDEEFSRGSAGAVQARFLGSLIREFGHQMIRTLTNIIPSNSLSCNPERDFVNSMDGSVYANHEVLGSDLRLCTKSDNEQKRRDIEYLVQRLQFPPGSVEVSITPGMSNIDRLEALLATV